MDTATLIVIYVISIGIVFAVPAPVPNADGGDSIDTDEEQSPICKSPSDTACYVKVNDPRRNGVINTKVQTEPYETYYKLRCSRGQKFNLIYTLAEDQLSDKCKDAIDLSDLS